MRSIRRWLEATDTHRALILMGARQVGKTTLLLQVIRRLLGQEVPPQRILYATFDHPLLKLTGLKTVLELWEELAPQENEQPLYFFLDEVQFLDDWQIWLKHQVDFHKRFRICVTGSAITLKEKGQESGVGRWETVRLPTLSFYEYLRLQRASLPSMPEAHSLLELFDWPESRFLTAAGAARGQLTAHFHQYLLRGGFPEPAAVKELSRCQRLLREDIVEKVLKRDMTALYGVRRVLEMEKLFLYLCYHDGGLLNRAQMASDLAMKQPLIDKFLELLEATHLLYRLKPFGYGKSILRGRSKYYLADPALPGGILSLGKSLLERNDRLGTAVETAFFKHVFTRYYKQSPRFSYWNDKRRQWEVDLIVQYGERVIPFEVKYRTKACRYFKSLRAFLRQHKISHGYLITREWSDFGVLPYDEAATSATTASLGLTPRILAIPAPLACYWLSDR